MYGLDGGSINSEPIFWKFPAWELTTAGLSILGKYQSFLYWWSLERGWHIYGTRVVLPKEWLDRCYDGAMYLRRSLSPLHAECEALILAMECMKTLQFSDVVFATDCSQLVKMVSTLEELPAFSTHMEEFSRIKTFFPDFRIRHISRTQNTLADKFACDAKNSPSSMLYVFYSTDLACWTSWISLIVLNVVVKKKTNVISQVALHEMKLQY